MSSTTAATTTASLHLGGGESRNEKAGVSAENLNLALILSPAERVVVLYGVEVAVM